jgi:tape measure domain-containing protein
MGMRDETLRFVAEIEGKKEALAIGKAFDVIGEAAENADPKAQALVDDIERLAKTDKAISGFAALKAQLQETGDKLFLARRRLDELQTEFDNTLEPSKKLTKELERARAEVARLAVDQNRQTAALQRAENTIKGAGYDLNQLARAQADVRDQTTRTTAEMRRYGAQLANTGKQASTTAGLLQRLRGIAAGVFAGLSIRGAAEGVKNVLELGDAAEKTRNQFTQLFGSVAAGDRAQAALKKFANDNAQPLDQTREAAIKLKAFGIDPLAGSLQSLVDENAAMGGSQERLEGTILAVGQAWAKQKLQGEEILQLVERGVPVWELLSKVTGKNVQELQKLSEQGKLGRKEISALLAEIGKMNSGAAAKNANTLSGLFTQLSSRVRQFFTDVSNSGPLDYFKQQLRDAIAFVDRLARTRELETWARNVGSAIVKVSSSIAGVAKFLVEHVDLIITLAKAYAAVKVGNFLAGLGSIAPAAAGASKGLGSLAAAAARLPGGIKIAIALIGLELAIKGATELGDAIGRNLPETQKWEERTRELNAETREAAERYLQATKSLEQYRDVQVKGADAVSVLTEKERTRYAEGIDGLERYLKSQIAYYNSLQQIGQLNDEGLQHLTGLRAKLAEVEATIKVLGQTTAVAADSLKSKLSENARLLVKDLESAGNSSAKLGEKLEKAFESIDTDSITKVGDIGVAIATVAAQSDAAGRAITNGLAASLRKLTGEDLLKFQASSVAAFDAVGISAQQQAAVLDTTLLVSMEKLGVAPEKFALGMSAAGEQSIAILQAITENARATSEQIEAAFTAAVRGASSKEDIEQLGNLLKAAADAGRISLEGAERAGYALQNRIREIAAITDPLADSFARLGIKSQASLNATRDSARDAFNAIVDGAKRGEASQYDVQRAFEAYAQTASLSWSRWVRPARQLVSALPPARAKQPRPLTKRQAQPTTQRRAPTTWARARTMPQRD